jgi:PAS domain S-box-containing protein
VLVFRDISAERAAEQEMRRQRELFDRFFALSLDMFCIAGADGSLNRVNPAFRSLGYTEEELLATTFLDLVHSDDATASRKILAGLACGVPTLAFENRFRCKDGSFQWIAWTMAPDPFGAIYAVGRNVTVQKRIADELIRSKDSTDAANAELETFSYSVAHDLRAPLRGINGFARAMLEDYEGTLDAKADDFLRRICAASEKMGGLIDALLGLSRVTRAAANYERVDLAEIGDAVIAQLRLGNDRVVDYVRHDAVVVHGDAQLLRALLENLLGNAWKFSSGRPAARIELGVERKAGTAENVYFVRDDGAGFDMAYAGKLFVPFQRLHRATEFPGTGIGLATAKRIVERHGGRLWADGKPGEGATFYFTLPLSAKDPG